MQESPNVTKLTSQQLDISNGYTNAEEANKENSLIKHEPVDGTPFYVTGSQEKGYFLRFADYQLTDPKKTIDEVLTELDQTYWQIITKLIICIVEIHATRWQDVITSKKQ